MELAEHVKQKACPLFVISHFVPAVLTWPCFSPAIGLTSAVSNRKFWPDNAQVTLKSWELPQSMQLVMNCLQCKGS